VVVDIGTGTGQSVLRRARREPSTLVIGVDAEASAMAAASRSAAADPRKGGLPNALFFVESAELLPGPLAGRADLVTVVLPWGSLLRGIIAADLQIVNGLSEMLRPDGELLLFLSEHASLPGLQTLEVRAAVQSDVQTLSSGWAKRLGIPGSRPAWIIRLKAR
jgi:SAM-dependent methyltransferase